MNARKLGRIAADLVRVNIYYLASGWHRNHLRQALKVDGLDSRQRKVIAREVSAASASARPFAGLADTSMALTSIVNDDLAPHVNLVISEVREDRIFAGIRTALNAAAGLCTRLSRPLRVVMVDFTSPDNNLARTEEFIRREFGVQVVLLPRERLGGAHFSKRDVWLASHWKTAHAVQIACTGGLIDPRRVAYLIQDYEPGFSAWSTEFAVASSTYHAGFVPLVNSIPLWRYLCEQEDLRIDRSLVFAPTFEEKRLREVAADRVPRSSVRVLFYGRPSKHRNLYRLGVSALKATVRELRNDDIRVEFFSAGEVHAAIDLGEGANLTALGKLSWDDYFAFLATTQVVLSLQFSPHPSHPPFDAALSGATAVTNEFQGTRAALHPRIVAVPADTVHLARALAQAIRDAKDSPAGAYLPVADNLLGDKLGGALDALLRELMTD